MRSPVARGDLPISSNGNFGWRTRAGNRAFHNGLDVSVQEGTHLVSPADGVVVYVLDNDVCGFGLVIEHSPTLRTGYCHLSRIDVKRRETLKEGQRIGLSGGRPGTRGAGLSTGPHLHFIVYEKNSSGKWEPVDPLGHVEVMSTMPVQEPTAVEPDDIEERGSIWDRAMSLAERAPASWSLPAGLDGVLVDQQGGEYGPGPVPPGVYALVIEGKPESGPVEMGPGTVWRASALGRLFPVGGEAFGRSPRSEAYLRIQMARKAGEKPEEWDRYWADLPGPTGLDRLHQWAGDENEEARVDWEAAGREVGEVFGGGPRGRRVRSFMDYTDDMVRGRSAAFGLGMGLGSSQRFVPANSPENRFSAPFQDNDEDYGVLDNDLDALDESLSDLDAELDEVFGVVGVDDALIGASIGIGAGISALQMALKSKAKRLEAYEKRLGKVEAKLASKPGKKRLVKKAARLRRKIEKLKGKLGIEDGGESDTEGSSPSEFGDDRRYDTTRGLVSSDRRGPSGRPSDAASLFQSILVEVGRQSSVVAYPYDLTGGAVAVSVAAADQATADRYASAAARREGVSVFVSGRGPVAYVFTTRPAFVAGVARAGGQTVRALGV